MGSVTPCDVLVVSGVVLETAVQDPDEAVSEGPQGSVVGVTSRSVGVVEEPGSR